MILPGAVALSSLGVAVSYCRVSVPEPEPTGTTHPNAARAAMQAQGKPYPPPPLSQADTQAFYHLSEGSELVPLVMLYALKRPGTQQSLYDSLEDFGLIDDPVHANAPKNSFKPRIGETVARPCDSGLGLVMLGFNCAACHVGTVERGGRSVIIPGAPSLFDIKGFVGALASALRQAVSSPAAFSAFGYTYLKVSWVMRDQLKSAKQAAGPVVGPCDASSDAFAHNEAKLNDEVDEATGSILLGGQLSERGATQWDLFLSRQREVHRLSLQTKAEFQRKIARVFARLEIRVRFLLARVSLLERQTHTHGTTAGPGRVDAFGTALNVLFTRDDETSAPVDFPHLWGFSEVTRLHWDGNTSSLIERNIGQAIGTGAPMIKGDHSMVHLANLVRLEDIARKLPPPAWPEDLFGRIDKRKAADGEEVYKKALCDDCHGKPEGYVEQARAETGTDEGRRLLFSPERRVFEGGVSREQAVVLGDRLTAVKEQWLLDNPSWSGLPGQFAARPPTSWQATDRYTARTLAGIWASAPYLHNGSVRSLRELLLPPDQRSQEPFCRGVRQYDPVAVGFRTDVACTFRLDPKEAGNHNGGHDYTQALSDDERSDLLEYLKTR